MEGRGKTLRTSCVSQRSQSRLNSHVKSVTSSCISLTFQCVSVRACVRACVCVCVCVCVVTASCNLLICHVCHLSRHQICLLCVCHIILQLAHLSEVSQSGGECVGEKRKRERARTREKRASESLRMSPRVKERDRGQKHTTRQKGERETSVLAPDPHPPHGVPFRVNSLSRARALSLCMVSVYTWHDA